MQYTVRLFGRRASIAAVVLAAKLTVLASTPLHAATPVLKGQTERPLRYQPVDNGFEITNGPDSFNRPLYGGHTAFRVDAGDRPEFSLYLPGRGGVLRVGLKVGDTAIWLRDAKTIQARYADGVMSYVVTDPAFVGMTVKLTVVALRDREGLALQADVAGTTAAADLLFAYGGLTGEKHKRNGDIGTDSVPMSQYFTLKPDHCRDNTVEAVGGGFVVKSKDFMIGGGTSEGGRVAVADARQWDDAASFATSGGVATDRPARWFPCR